MLSTEQGPPTFSRAAECGAGVRLMPADVIDCLEELKPGSLELDTCLWAVLGGQ